MYGALVNDKEGGTPAMLTLFSTAHHDIWWAKGHAWTVSNWSITGIAGLSTLSHLTHPQGGPALSPTLLLFAITLLTLAASAYLSQKQADMVTARLRADFMTFPPGTGPASIGGS